MSFLNDHERAQLKIQHKHERDGRIRDRIKAVLLTDDGWTPQQIAKVLLISDQAIREHVHEYKVSKKLKPENGGSEEKLSEEQSKQLVAHLETHTYLYVKDIVAYVTSTFKMAYTVAGMRHWLRRHSFSYKKPAIVPGKADKDVISHKVFVAEDATLNADSTIRFFQKVEAAYPTKTKIHV